MLFAQLWKQRKGSKRSAEVLPSPVLVQSKEKTGVAQLCSTTFEKWLVTSSKKKNTNSKAGQLD